MVWAGPIMAQPKWLAMARPFFLKKKTKNPKIFKNHFKKS